MSEYFQTNTTLSSSAEPSAATTCSLLRRRHPPANTSYHKQEREEPALLVRELLIQKKHADGDLPAVPNAIICSDALTQSDAASVDDGDVCFGRKRRRFDKVYDCPPVVDRSTILAVGLFVFALAVLWPPLILLFSYIASKLIPYTLRENDDAATRRELYSQFLQDEDNLPEKFIQRFQKVNIEESYWTNERGMVLCTCIMTPKNKPITAVVCFCHGYTDHVAFSKICEFQRLCEHGIAFVGIEYEGHGRSDGPLGLINDWEGLIDDVSSFFKEVTAQPRFEKLPAFLMGESMGGAVAYWTYNRIPNTFRGVVFVCPMCKISDDMLPPQYVIDFLKCLLGPSGTTSFLGYLPIAPSKDLGDVTYRIREKGLVNWRCPLIYDRNPRLATARELIDVTQRISSGLADFDAPFLVLHGKADRVTDPVLSQALYDESKSSDKSIRLYEGMWHALTSGESDENIDLVFQDVIDWILQRSSCGPEDSFSNSTTTTCPGQKPQQDSHNAAAAIAALSSLLQCEE